MPQIDGKEPEYSHHPTKVLDLDDDLAGESLPPAEIPCEDRPLSWTPLVESLGEKLVKYNEAVAETTNFRASIGNAPVPVERFHEAVLLSTSALARGWAAMKELNTIAVPPVRPEDRHFSISQACVVIACLGIKRKGGNISSEEDDLFHLYTSTHPEGLIIDDRLAGLLELFEIRVPPDIHPGRRVYFARSASQREAGLALLEQLERAQEQQSRLNNSDTATEGQLSAVDRKIDDLNKQLDAAFKRMTDVDPTQVPQLLERAKISMLYGTHVMGPYASFSSSLVKLISAGLGIIGETGLSGGIQIPVVSDEGRLIMLPASVEDPSAVLLPERLNAIMYCLYRNRAVLSECAGMLKLFWQLGSPEFNSMSDSFYGCLRPLPFAEELASRKPAGTEKEFMRLITQPSWGLPNAVAEYGIIFPYADPVSSFHQFDFVVRAYMAADDDLAGQYERMFAHNKDFSHSAAGYLKTLRRALKGSAFKPAFPLIETLIKRDPGGKDIDLGIAQPAALIALSQMCEDPSVARKLKNGIRNVEDIGSMVPAMRTPDDINPMENLVPDLIKSLSKTLDDFYGNEELVACLRAAVEEFLYASKHPELFYGITPDRILCNSWYLYGAPGVGKTQLVKCVASEFGLKLFRIAIETVEGSKSSSSRNEKTMSVEDKIMLLDQQLDKVKKHAESEPCIVQIDEYEEYAPDRWNPRTEADQKKLTNYVNRTIDIIKRDCPNIFLFALSNFTPDEVDEASTRDGRYAIVCEVKAPTEKDIAKIIEDTIAIEAPDLHLTDDQIKEVSEKALDLMPFSIIHAICRRSRFLAEGEELTYEALLDAILQKTRDRAIDLERNRRRREAVKRTDGRTDRAIDIERNQRRAELDASKPEADTGAGT